MLETESWQEIRKAPAEGKQGHNLGAAIIAAAIADYRGLGYYADNLEDHIHAKHFLYPPNDNWQRHLNWVVSLATGVDPGWLRSSLDRLKPRWDKQRAARMQHRCARRQANG